MDFVPNCTCTEDRPCRFCVRRGSSLPYFSASIDTFEGTHALDSFPKFISNAFNGALTCFFALAGAFTGAITGALAGRASHCGVFRGAGLGAVAGAVLSMEVLEASRAYWCLEQSGSRGPSSMADFIEELLRGRVDEFSPSVLAYRWQVTIADMNYDDFDNAYVDVASRGLSVDSLKKLPCYTLDEKKSKQAICCTICLQEIEIGQIVRSLPRCHHMFHLVCVDKWLVRHGSCPICRRDV